MGRCADLRWSCARLIHVLASRVCGQSCEGRSLRDTLVRMTRSVAPIKLSEYRLLWFISVFFQNKCGNIRALCCHIFLHGERYFACALGSA